MWRRCFTRLCKGWYRGAYSSLSHCTWWSGCLGLGGCYLGGVLILWARSSRIFGHVCSGVTSSAWLNWCISRFWCFRRDWSKSSYSRESLIRCRRVCSLNGVTRGTTISLSRTRSSTKIYSSTASSQATSSILSTWLFVCFCFIRWAACASAHDWLVGDALPNCDSGER